MYQVKKGMEGAKFFYKGNDRRADSFTNDELKAIAESNPAFVAEYWDEIPKAKSEKVDKV